LICLSARDAEEREQWIRALEDTIKRHSQSRKVRCKLYFLKPVYQLLKF